MLRRAISVLALCGAALVFQGASCRPKPPNPIPTPTPPPAPAGPTHPEMVLRVQGTDFLLPDGSKWRMRGCSFCCMESPVKTGWPLAHEHGLEWLKDQGDCNLVELRPGPFLASSEPEWAETGGVYVEVNGKADLDQFNPKFAARLDAIIADAAARGMWVLIDATDAWRVKHQQAGDEVGLPWAPHLNVQGEDVLTSAWRSEITGGRPAAYLTWLFGIVLRHGNVMVQDGNEPDQIDGPAPLIQRWSLSTHNFMRAVEAEKGYPRHVFVSNLAAKDQGFAYAPQIDAVSVHTGSAVEPQAGKPIFNSEFNPSPPWTAKTWQQIRCISVSWGGWVGAWRHGQEQPTWEQTLAEMRRGCEGVPVAGCPFETPEVTKISVKRHGVDLYDSTPKVQDGAYCQKVGFPGWGECPVLPEGNALRGDCELAAMGGEIRWQLREVTGTLAIAPRHSGFQFTLSGSGAGLVFCDTAKKPGVNLCRWSRDSAPNPDGEVRISR